MSDPDPKFRTRFQKGQSGNPGGRPKNPRPKPEIGEADLKAELARLVVAQFSKMELLTILCDALKQMDKPAEPERKRKYKIRG